jgi:hypothetical protein
METQAEGQEAILLQLRRHNREIENQQNIPLFFIPDMNLQVLDDSRATVTLRERILQISKGLTIFPNNTDIPGHYKLIIKAQFQDIKSIRDKVDEFLRNLFDGRTTLYNQTWGLPTAYKFKPRRIETPNESDAITVYRQRMKNQVVKYKKEEAQIVTLAQAKVLTKGKTVVNVGTNVWNTTTTKQTTQTNVLDLNDSSQVKKFVAYFSEVTGLTAIKEEQQEIRKAMETRDNSIDARLDQQAQDVQTLIETTRQNTKAIQDNDHSYKQAIETIASSQKAIMEYFAQAVKSTQHDNTTITTQASTDISQLTPDPKSHCANDQAAGTHNNSEMTRGEET